MSELKKLAASVSLWLDATTRGMTPRGEKTQVIRVQPGEEVKVLVVGSQNFGSGGYSGMGAFTGPVEKVSTLLDESDSCIRREFALYRMTAPSVIHTGEMDGIGGGRSWITTYICASDEQIAAAQLDAVRERAIECRDADLAPLTAQIVRKMMAEEKHLKQCGQDEHCSCGPELQESDMQTERRACRGEVDESRLAGMHLAVARAIRRLATMPESERRDFWAAAEAAFAVKSREARRDFARKVHKRLVEGGLLPKAAQAVISAAGPGRALQAVEWAFCALDATKGSVDALDCVLKGAGGTHGFGADRMRESLKALSIPVPHVSSSTGLFAVLRGGHAAVLGGLPWTSLDAEASATAQ